MKTIKFLPIVLCLFVNTLCYAQFPAPRSFEEEIHYIGINEGGWCNGEWVNGPVNCLHFKWQIPDTLDTEAQLTGYKIYHYRMDIGEHEFDPVMEIPFSEGEVILQIDYYESENYEVSRELGFETGVMWITAVYSSPEGESAPSNIVYHPGIAISVDEIEMPRYSLIYSREKGGINVTGIENSISFTVFRIDGTAVKSGTESGFNFIDTKNIGKGIYIIKITTEERVISNKIIIE